jgi:GAF domain-containing protein
MSHEISIVTASGTRVNATIRALVATTCAASAGIHAALVPEHYHEAGLSLAAAFAASALALALCALLARRPGRDAHRLTAAVLLTVAAAYLLSRTTGIPLLVPEPERFEALGVLTTVAEVVAAAAAVCLPSNRREIR